MRYLAVQTAEFSNWCCGNLWVALLMDLIFDNKRTSRPLILGSVKCCDSISSKVSTKVHLFNAYFPKSQITPEFYQAWKPLYFRTLLDHPSKFPTSKHTMHSISRTLPFKSLRFIFDLICSIPWSIPPFVRVESLLTVCSRIGHSPSTYMLCGIKYQAYVPWYHIELWHISWSGYWITDKLPTLHVNCHVLRFF